MTREDQVVKSYEIPTHPKTKSEDNDDTWIGGSVDSGKWTVDANGGGSVDGGR
jgi:hypothetical protein